MRTFLLLAIVLIAGAILFTGCEADAEIEAEIWVYQGGPDRTHATAIDDHIYDVDDDPDNVPNPTTQEATDPTPDKVRAGWYEFTAETDDVGDILNLIVSGASADVQLALFNEDDDLICYSDFVGRDIDFVFGLVDTGTIYIYIGTPDANLEDDTLPASGDITFDMKTGTYDGPTGGVDFDFAIDYDLTSLPQATGTIQGAGLYIYNPFEHLYGVPLNIASQTLADIAITTSAVVEFSKQFSFGDAGTYMMAANIMGGQVTANVMTEGSLFYADATDQSFDVEKACFVINLFDITGGTDDINNPGYDFAQKTSFHFGEMIADLYYNAHQETISATVNADFHDLPEALLSGVINITDIFNGVVVLPAGNDYNFTLAGGGTTKSMMTQKVKDTQLTLRQLAKKYPGKALRTRTFRH